MPTPDIPKIGYPASPFKIDVSVPDIVPMLTRQTAQRGNGFRQLGHACTSIWYEMMNS